MSAAPSRPGSTPPTKADRRFAASCWAAGILVTAALVVYGPYFDNPRVFDDLTVFGSSFAIAAISPWEFGTRALPYFSLAFVEVIFGQMWVHRLLNCLIHAATGWCVYLFARDLIEDSAAPDTTTAAPCALVAAVAFVVSPVAVYATGYLVQRSILMATLFSLAALVLFRDGIVSNRRGRIVAAAACYALAMLSKEQAILVPLVGCALALKLARDRQVRVKAATGLFLALCAPVALWALATRLSILATAYEPHLAAMQAERFPPPTAASNSALWLMNAGVQARLFFDYAGMWLAPDTRRMSVDLRIDLSDAGNLHAAATHALAYAAVGAAAAGALLLRSGAWRVAAFATVYAWTMFLTELSAIRFQEPFVLYRSYIWAPACAIVLAQALRFVHLRLALGAAFLAVPVMVWAAYDRLDTFRTPLQLWSDAANKLPSPHVPGARRIYFLRGGEYYRAGRYEEALRDADLAVYLAPRNAQMRLARGITLSALGRLREAADEFRVAVELDPHNLAARRLLKAMLARTGDGMSGDRTVSESQDAPREPHDGEPAATTPALRSP